jgi:phenylacetate-CoA ligase
MIRKLILSLLSKIEGNDFGDEWNEVRKIRSEKDLSDAQEKYLKALLLHAYLNVPYYHEVLERGNVEKNGKVDIDQFNAIPLLTKHIIRRCRKKLISNDYGTRKWYHNSSGGSTGEPVTFVQDYLYSKWRNATLRYYYEDMIGIDESDVKKVLLWGSERDTFEGTIGLKAKLSNRLTNTVFLNSFRMTERDMERYVKTINSYRPDLIRGYAGSLHELCKFVQRKRLPIHSPKVVVSAAETLHEEMREKIERVFGTKVYNYYGTREVGPIAGECKYGLIHIFTFDNYVDIINGGSKLERENHEGEIIVTNLHNYSMPFIRYEIGDMAVLGPKKCRCGSQLPTFKKITGRVIEHFIRKDGTVIPGEFFIHLIGVVCNKGFIRKFQVVQEDYEKIRLFLVPEGAIDEHDKRDINDKLRVVMGDNCKIIWEIVDEIPKLKNGKYLCARSLVHRT